jgi:hypothetical protein
MAAYSTWALYEDTLGLTTLAWDDGYAVTGYDPGFAAHREVVEDNSDADGEHDTTRFHGPRVVTLDLRLLGEPADRHRLRTTLAAYCRADQRPALRWVSPHLGPVETVGRIADLHATIPGAMRAFTARLVQRVPTGLIRATDTQTFTVRPGAGVIQTGRTYNLTYDRVYPSGTVIGAASIVVGGNAPVKPVIRIYGPIVNPDLSLSTGGRWKFSGNGGVTLGAGDFIEIDVENRTVYLNANPTLTRYNYLDFATLNWSGLQPGAQTGSLDGTGVDSNTQATLEAHISWL